MPSWREATPKSVQDDLDGIVTAALNAAQDLLTKNGEFFPFAMTMSASGEMGLAAADPGLGEQPASLAVLDSLCAGALGNREAYRAVGFVAEVKANGGDVVRVEAEHRDGGPALVIVMPYQRKGLVKKVVADIDLHPDSVSNQTMGYIFEELIRRFSEASNETAGERFTPLPELPRRRRASLAPIFARSS